jgi:Uma2 family endonuclease
MSATAAVKPAGSARGNWDEPLYEIVNGRKVELLPMSIYACWIANLIGRFLGSHAESNRLGRVVVEGLFILDAVLDLRRRPDVAFVSAERWPLDRPLPETGDWEVVPDLAVEVVSPNDIMREVQAKIREYFRLSVRQVWIVLPEEQEVYVYDSPTQVRILTANDALEGGTFLPGFHLPVASLFQKSTTAGAAN